MLAGELYWSVSFAQASGVDGWETQWCAGGNGDGTLTYRGTPDRIGGTTEVPLASIRLKAIRDGQEDLLYMIAAEARAGREATLAAIAPIIGGASSFVDDPTALAAAREALAALIEQ